MSAAMSRARMATLLALFIFPAMGNTILLAVVPLAALDLFGSPRAVTLLYVVTGCFAVAGRFMVPRLVQLIGRLAVMRLGAASIAAAAALLAAHAVPAMPPGLVLLGFGFACVEITNQLVMLDLVPRAMLARFEPLRIFASAIPWTLGPWLGVRLQETIGFTAPFLVTMAMAAAIAITIATLRFDQSPRSARPTGSANPIIILRRFFAQPRLRLAWALAVSRSSFWNMFYVYTPIFAVTAGMSAETGGAISSIGTVGVIAAPAWGWLGRRIGLRALLLGGYVGTGVLMIAVAFSFTAPALGAVLLVGAAIAASAIDGAGNILFLKAVHPHERPAMTTAFMSFRDASQLFPPAVCSLLLTFFALPSVFIAAGCSTLLGAWLTRHIHPRL